MRQAFAGMLWSKQLYYYDVARWLDGDPTQPRPPESRRSGRNARWRNFDAFDIMSMPDKWEYPWFAAWDLAFHCVALAHVDPAFAKYQLILLCREWFQHPNGALPAYEWDFGDVNPPVQAWAALEVFAIDGGRDLDFLSQVFDKLLVNFTWWVNREDAERHRTCSRAASSAWTTSARSTAPTCRSAARCEQSDATGWMASYALAMGDHRRHPATAPASARRTTSSLKFLEHFAAIRSAIGRPGPVGRRRRAVLRPAGHPGRRRRCRSRSGRWSGIIPLLAAAVIDEAMLDRALAGRQELRAVPGARGPRRPGEARRRRAAARRARATAALLLGVVGIDRLERLFAKLFDEAEFLSPHGLRALSAYHRDHPYELEVEGVRASIDYEPAESTTVDVRRQLQLARPGLVPAQLPGDRARWSATTGSSATTAPSSTRPGRASSCTLGRDRRGPARAADLALHRSARTGGGPASAASSGCRPTRPGRTT